LKTSTKHWIWLGVVGILGLYLGAIWGVRKAFPLGYYVAKEHIDPNTLTQWYRDWLKYNAVTQHVPPL